jgi:spermidine synthase
MATLLLELSLTRIFSVVFYYHFAFLAISIALFGLGAGGVFSYVVAEWKGSLYQKLGRLSAVNSFLVILALTTVLTRRNDPSNWELALVYFTTALPFFISGAIVSLAISETMERINRVYFFDLLGAAGGCLILIPLLDGFGGPNTLIATAIIYAVAAAIWHSMADSVKGRVFSVGLALVLVAFLTYNQGRHVLDIRHAKGQTISNEIFQKWNSFSRVAVAKVPEEGRDEIRIDADAATGIANFDFANLTAQERSDLLEQGPALPYVVRPGAKTLIIGPGGGWDVARALASGSRDITGVEINPIIAKTIMSEKFADKSRGLYLRPEVRIVVEDGRAFVRRSPEKYQVLQATLVDTWASTAAGAFALSENNLYTTDAMRDYLSHLTPDGVLAFTRWGFDPPRESLRLISLAMEGLRELGMNQPSQHIIVAREGSVKGWGARDTVLISRSPFSQADIERAKTLLRHMQTVYLPGAGIRNHFTDLLTVADPVQYQRDYIFDISPVTDNRPFFFYTVQPRDLWKFITTAATDTADYKINKAVPLLFGLMAVSLFATALILVLPPLILGTKLPAQRGVRGYLMFFLFIGAGYILIEVALIQKFVLFLGHPTYALTVVIFSLLVSSGVGSALSRRVLGKDEGRLIKALGCVALLAVVLALAVSSFLSQMVGLPLALKMAITTLMIAPLGFMMGMPFPTALERLEEWHAPSVRWAWSLNAASSVLGSVGALVCSIYLGLIQTLIIGGMFYLAALAVAARSHNHHAPAIPGTSRVVLAK